MNYNIGDRVRCTGTLATTAGTATDPTTAHFWFWHPGTKIVTTYQYGVNAEIVRSSAGVYYVDLDVDAPGGWYYGFYSTGTAKAASPDTLLTVLDSRRGNTHPFV